MIEKKAEKQLFSTFVLSFYVIQQLLCFCLTYIPASLYPTLFMILPTKDIFFKCCRCGLCYGITLQVVSLTGNTHSLEILDSDTHTTKGWST